MIEDRRAHARLDTLEEVLRAHIVDHARIESRIEENTGLTQKAVASLEELVKNTAEVVQIIKGVKVTRKFVIWSSPVWIAGAAIWAAIIAIWSWVKGHL